MAGLGRTRTNWVAQLDRQMAEAEAIGRAVRAGATLARVIETNRIEDPRTGQPVWEIVLEVGRKRRLP